MNNTLETRSTKNEYYEKSKEEIKDQLQNCYHQEGGKKRLDSIMKIRKAIYKDRYVELSIIRCGKKIRKGSNKEIYIDTGLKKSNEK